MTEELLRITGFIIWRTKRRDKEITGILEVL